MLEHTINVKVLKIYKNIWIADTLCLVDKLGYSLVYFIATDHAIRIA